MLNFAVAAVAGIPVVGAVSAYFDKYLATSVSQWVGRDLRRTIYQHIQRLSIEEHDEVRAGDLITRVTGDIAIIQPLQSWRSNNRDLGAAGGPSDGAR
jgi:ABC-type multidrug transport system fused ATPase/permease subunit